MHDLPIAAAPSTSPSQLSPGFTLVELLVATVALSVGLLALTGAGAAIMKLERRGDALSRAAAAGETRLELLRADGCSAESGSSDSGPIAERWVVTPLAGGASEIVDSVKESIVPTGSASMRVFRSAARC